MQLRQQIVQNATQQVAKTLDLPEEAAFLRFAHSVITGQSLHAFNESDLVDGAQDKGIDTITFDERDEDADVYILQGKYTHSFSSNAIVKLRNGLNWMFNRPRKDVERVQNLKLRDNIVEYRSIQGGQGPANIRVRVAVVTNGATSALEDDCECLQEVRNISAEYGNDTFEEFTVRLWGCDELVEEMNVQERKARRIDEELRVIYDANNPSLMKYHSQGLKGAVCTLPGREIARVVKSDKLGSLFDSNVRRFLGTRGAVNADILSTCTNKDVSHQFWFLNNGITMVCDSFDAVTDPDNPHVKVKNLQIVNGCQTATALAVAAESDRLPADVRVLVRIYEAPEAELVDRIVLTTNNQNRIGSRDLRANDPIQVDMERRFSDYRYLYERKARQFAGEDVDRKRIAANELVGQSYLAIVLRKPSDARRRKYKIWGELYDQVFAGQMVEPYIVAFEAYRRCVEHLRTLGLNTAEDDLVRKLARNGAFHIARIAYQTWRGTDWSNEHNLKEQINALTSQGSGIEEEAETALQSLAEIVRSSEQFISDVDRALKSGELDRQIDRRVFP